MNDLLQLTKNFLGDINVDSFGNTWGCLEIIDRAL
jgi:hypothetical protein